MSAPAFLLAAGFGTRLRPLTLHRPKPLVPFMGRPLLDQAIALLLAHGIQDVVVNAHYLADAVEDWAAQHNASHHKASHHKASHHGAEARVRLIVSREEPDILGTGGGLRKVMDQLADPFVVVNGDILCDVDLGALLAATPEGGAAMALRTLRDGEAYGVVQHDGARVVDLVGLAAAAPQGPVDRGTHFTGVHAMSRAALSLVPPEGEACVVRTAYIALVPDRQVAALKHRGLWVDLGDPAAYLKAHLLALEGAITPAQDNWPLAGLAVDAGGVSYGSPALIDQHPDSELRHPVWLGQGARIEPGAVVGPRVVVGDGAVIEAGVRLEDAVVWDGVTVPSGTSLLGGVVHDGGVLSIPGVK